MKLVTANCGSQFLFLVRFREMGIKMSHFLSHNTRRSATLNRNNLCHTELVEVRHSLKINTYNPQPFTINVQQIFLHTLTI